MLVYLISTYYQSLLSDAGMDTGKRHGDVIIRVSSLIRQLRRPCASWATTIVRPFRSAATQNPAPSPPRARLGATPSPLLALPPDPAGI